MTPTTPNRLAVAETGSLNLYRRAEPSIRRFLDVLIAVLALVLLSPVLLLVAVLIRLTSPGPAFFVQDRIGRDGERFPFIKFRTMAVDAHERREDVLGAPNEDMTEAYRIDPRITPVGHVLRRWSMDELPQLINVALGQMSIVGPRPIMPEEEPLLKPEHLDRHAVKPGMTGLWQVSGRKETTWEERMALDLEYVQTRTVASDLRIMSKTFLVVIKGDGAY